MDTFQSTNQPNPIGKTTQVVKLNWTRWKNGDVERSFAGQWPFFKLGSITQEGLTRTQGFHRYNWPNGLGFSTWHIPSYGWTIKQGQPEKNDSLHPGMPQ